MNPPTCFAFAEKAWWVKYMNTLDSICLGEWRNERDGRYVCTAVDHIGELDFDTKRELLSYECPYCQPERHEGYPLCGKKEKGPYGSR